MTIHDRNVGLQSLMMSGCQVTTLQALIFELLRDAEHEYFKPLLKQVVMDNYKDADGKTPTLDLFYTAEK